MATRKPIVLVSGLLSEVPVGDITVELAASPSGLIYVGSKLGIDGSAQISGNAALVVGTSALASGNAALTSASLKLPLTGGVLTGVLAVTAGTAALPAITPSGDPNTGIFSPGADQVAISTNGTGRLSIDASGNVAVDTNTLYVDAVNNRVAIGTTAPTTTLDVVGSSSTEFAALRVFNNAGSAGSQNSVSILMQNINTLNNLPSAKLIAQEITNDSNVANLIFQTSNDNAASLSEVARFSSSGSLAARIFRLASGTGGVQFNGQTDTGINGGTQTLQFTTAGSERARIDANGRLLVGTSTARANFFNSTFSAALQVEGTGNDSSMLSIVRNSADTGRALLTLAKTRGGSVGSTTVVQSGDQLGSIEFQGSDGTEFVQAASIQCEVDGTPGANDMPGRLVFSVTGDGSASPTERMRITSAGDILIGKTDPSSVAQGITLSAGGQVSFTTNASICATVNRQTDDGTLINLVAQDVVEGTISVSGTTVSYNGGHLSRWSQLASGANRTEILRGSVLSNLDEMCEWGEEKNEQLNCMKVSTVEGDKNVSGVFQCWDDDDDTYTNDFYCAMTGDFIIRIADGVTVERGDLLMSAGNGTAKPQDDDIIRSKTVAKVTSTNVSCTYEDGSYCVPCVLMAC